MVKRSTQTRAVEKRKSILHAATELLLSEGLKGVTHRNVAAKAGVPVGSIGYYFSTREKLIATCFGELAATRRIAYEEAVSGKVDLTDPVQFAESVVDVVSCGRPTRTRELSSAFIDAQRESGEVEDLVEETLTELRAMITEMMRIVGVEGITSSRVLQMVIGTAVTEEHPTAPIAAVTDLLRLAEH